MDSDFWHERWKAHEIGFHLDRVNPILVDYLPQLNLEKGKRIFVPLCGKTLDIPFLLSQGFEVVAVELSELAIEDLFAEMHVTPEVETWKGGDVFLGPGLKVFVGDYFALTREDLGVVDAVYDRAALIALPKDMRLDYVVHQGKICGYPSQLLITLEYKQEQMSGPPFSVAAEEVEALFGGSYSIRLLNKEDVISSEPRFQQRGLDSLLENAFILN